MPARSAAMLVLNLFSGRKWVFRSAGATHCLDKRDIWHRGALPRAIFHVYWGRNVGIQPPKLSKFIILAINLPLRCNLFAPFLRNSQVAFKFLIWSLSGIKNQLISIFPRWGFSQKFSVAPCGETADRIIKVRVCKNGTDLLYHHAKYGGDRGSLAGVRWKTVMLVWLFITGRPARSAAMPVLHLLSGPKMGFLPHRGDRLPR